MATGEGVRTTELVQAFLWTCDDCGRDNFERAITIAPESINQGDLPSGLDADDLREWAQQGGNGLLAMAPDRVRCGHCRAEFATIEA